ncbi:MAG TPA: hypothetical protein VMM18_06670 [Gemmatimonadaceae bacterium]|nr:hypothetical protein [Gemmatimonadaceae bacterium]
MMTSTQRIAAVVAAVLLAFLLGFAWQAIRANRTGAELQRTERVLDLTRLEATLGAAAIDAQRGSFEASRQSASDFFTGLQTAIDHAPAGAQAELRSILAERDVTITMLSRGDPQAGDQLSRMFLRYRLALGRRVSSPAAPAPVPGAVPDTPSPADPPTGSGPD